MSKRRKKDILTVVDFFCGAGGFSEGFKQLGFKIVHGYDSWQPAIDTFNHNFDLSCQTKNILDFKSSIEQILEIPDTDIIIGSPPCVSFSSSNKSGKADKSLGLALTETFLRIVAVKKHQKNSQLKAWYMENVPNSKRYLQTQYTFKDLDLEDWATSQRISPNKVAIDLSENSAIINSADYGALQARKRLISGEIIKKKKLIIPKETHSDNPEDNKSPYKALSILKDNFPTPYSKKSSQIIKDVQYDISIEQDKITDQFYDTGVYKVEWKFSKYWKQNHPFMGRMAFPENEENPSRTITATRITNSRESIIYRSEHPRKGDGEFRLPTVRETAILMGFPITYQFLGSEGTKAKLVGNAVCCCVSRAFARETLEALGYETPANLLVTKIPNLTDVADLNTYELKTFDNPPLKKKNARFRRHPFKYGNLTVTLSNYDIDNNIKRVDDPKWFTSIQYGTGNGFPIQKIEDEFYKSIEAMISTFENGEKFIDYVNSELSPAIADRYLLQKMYEQQASQGKFKEPTELIDDLADVISSFVNVEFLMKQKEPLIFKHKESVPVSQFFALYAINKITTIANTMSHE